MTSSPAGLRVLMLCSSYAPRLGGVEKHVQRAAQELIRLGCEVCVAAPRWSDDLPPEGVVAGVPVVRLPTERKEAFRRLAPLVRWSRVVHTHDAYPFLKYYLPFRFLHPRTPVFVTFHGYERYPIPREARILRRVVWRLTNDAVCVGGFIPKWYRFPCRNLTYGGVDAPGELRARGNRAVFVGRVEPDTSLPTYLRLLAVLRVSSGVDLPLDVCGDGSLRGEAEELARSLGVRATFHGMTPNPRRFLEEAEFAFVSGYLGMLEAMAAGAVVVATYENPLKEDYLRLFPGAPHAVIGGSVADLAAEVARLCEDPEKRREKRVAAFRFARGQTWEKVARLYLQLYRGARAEATSA